ncbi:MAG TPA: sigma 54-interacting transcriptional regulator [Chloroflexota bacterium]|jgi:magnesium chelatase subunit I|nr:sigma 54-interacting transcriptional regulator [Chloroflexota bacterium]
MTTAATIGELKATGYASLPVKAEMRKNLLLKLAGDDPIFPEILGYESTVVPQIENAVLSEQDIILLGERGQAKTRIARALVTLLDPEVPVIAGCEINDAPFEPICAPCRERVAERGDDTLIDWLPRAQRYGEKLATPDTTIADLIGEVDPIKIAEGRYLADEETIHFGLIPRTNRGIFCINELPDLAERIQVGLLNIMEERDIQIRGYKIRLPLDVFVVASANPEDYTNRGRIITPLKDRCGSEIRTHYPRTTDLEIEIMEQERTPVDAGERPVIVPGYIREIIAEITHLARKSPDVSQRSGVSVRVSISNYENVMSNALKRTVRLHEKAVVPRITDLPAIMASTTGKIELETIGDTTPEKVVDKLLQAAILNVFNRYFLVQEFDDVLSSFDNGLTLEASQSTPSLTYAQEAFKLTGMKAAVTKLNAAGNPALIASAVEFILEGLHLNRKLNKDRLGGKGKYRR